jgi:ABC-2 type transport system ATP-binding protein
MGEQQLDQDQMPIITTTRLTKKFGNLVAVNNLHLEVQRGDVFGFLGPNGSGKTTTIRMLLGLLQPTTGTVHIFGRDTATHLAEILPRIGAIIEAPVYYSYLSGLDNLHVIAMNSGLRGGTATNRRIAEILEMVDLTSQAKDAVRKYSLGMKQRLAIGMALLTDPELILLDEPTNGLDPMGVHEMRGLISRLAAAGKTVVLSSHILHEVQQVCNRVAILQKGRMVRQGEVRRLLQQGERLLVRMNTPEEAQYALGCLQSGRERGAEWITQVSNEHGAEISIDAPVTRASEIVALLAQQQLYLAEIRPQESSLEEVFMELVAPEESRTGMVALAGER